ncbi:DUF1801 domain-containing protein [Alphaproteobacteria bacterium]|nr:DUF1801 domain-containing protein [Alphaproteobacteria bacterium]
MANKTQRTTASVKDFIAAVEHKGRREDSLILLNMMKRATGFEPAMWGDSVIGFGEYHYKYDSGREGDFLMTGFSPRKAAMSVYLMPGFKLYEEQLARLGKHKHSVSCLYLSRLDKLDLTALEEMIVDSVKRMKEIYPQWKP